MAIKARITADEYNALAAPLKEHYKSDEAGGYRLDVPDAEDVYARPLKSALDKERDAVKEAERKLAAAKADFDKFKDIDPDKARAALKKIEDIEDKHLLDEGKVEELLGKRTEKMRLDFENREKTLATQIADKDKALLEVMGKLERTMIDQGLTLAASKANVRPGALSDVIRRGREVFKLEEDRVLPYKDGALIYGKNASEPMSMEEWVTALSLSDDGKHLFEGNKGAGTVPGQRIINGQNVIVLSREEARNPQRYREAQEQAAKSGMDFRVADA